MLPRIELRQPRVYCQRPGSVTEVDDQGDFNCTARVRLPVLGTETKPVLWKSTDQRGANSLTEALSTCGSNDETV